MSGVTIVLGSGGLRTPERIDAWVAAVEQALAGCESVLFLPYALAEHEAYLTEMQRRFAPFATRLVGAHNMPNPAKAISEVDAVFVGGGNTWRLLREMYRLDLLQPLRERVAGGMPYLGISAGSNVAAPSILTTNDMPITLPPRAEALGLVPFQINPHFVAGTMYLRNDAGEYEAHGGETRDERLAEFHEENETPILALWEGAILLVQGETNAPTATLAGPAGARWFDRGNPPQDLRSGTDITDIVYGRAAMDPRRN